MIGQKLYEGLARKIANCHDGLKAIISESKTSVLLEMYSETEKIVEKIDELEKKEIAFLKEENEKLKKGNEEKDYVIESLDASIVALAQGTYDKEYVQFFALKTYREWKYCCLNGEVLKLNGMNAKIAIKKSGEATVSVES